MTLSAMMLLLGRTSVPLIQVIGKFGQGDRRLIHIHCDFHHRQASTLRNLWVSQNRIQVAPVVRQMCAYRVGEIVSGSAKVVRRFQVSPRLNVIVRCSRPVYEALDGVPRIVKDEDDDIESVPDNVTDSLRAHLETTIALK